MQEPQRYKEYATWANCVSAAGTLAGGTLLLGRGDLSGLIMLAVSAVLWWLGVRMIIRRWKVDISIAYLHGEQRGAEVLMNSILKEGDD